MTSGKIAQTILIVGDFANVNGGQAKVAIDSARLLADAGKKVIFFAGSGPISERLTHDRIEVVCIESETLANDQNRLRAAVRGLWNKHAQRSLQAVVSKLDPKSSVIHCHGWSKSLSPSIGPVLAFGGIKTLYTMHEYFLACPNGGFYDYPHGEICTRQPLSRDCCLTNCDVRHWTHKAWRVARSATAKSIGHLPSGLTDVAYISELQRKIMSPYLPEHVKLHPVPNPVAPGGPLIDASKNNKFLFVGRLSAEKGSALFAEAARLAGVDAVFIGDGPEAENLRRSYPDAEFAGWLSADEISTYLTTARALVFPSLWYECQPLVPIEAILRGVPVVCGAWTAASEVVENGRTGVLVDTPDAAAFANGINDVRKLPAFSSADLADRVSPENHLARLCDIYDDLLAGQ